MPLGVRLISTRKRQKTPTFFYHTSARGPEIKNLDRGCAEVNSVFLPMEVSKKSYCGKLFLVRWCGIAMALAFIGLLLLQSKYQQQQKTTLAVSHAAAMRYARS